VAKIKSAFFCQSCGYETPKWTGQCPSCHAWNTLTEEVIARDDKKATDKIWKEQYHLETKKAQSIQDIDFQQELRILTPDDELNRVLGGGFVPGSVILVAGDPGIGKSTLFLQTVLQWKGLKTL